MDTNQLRPDHEHVEAAERSLARLLKLSGERGAPSEEATARAHAAALDTWQNSLRQARATRVRYGLSALAAMLSIVLIGAAAWNAFDVERAAPRTLAQVVALSAPATIVASDGVATDVKLGAAITTSMQLHTRAGRGALAIGDSLSLRLNTDTKLRFDDENQIRLLAGAIYVDSGGLNVASNLRILTPAGEVRHEGTQYQVVVSGELTQIKVREGRVRLVLADEHGSEIPVVAGEQIHVDDLTVSKRSVPSFGPDWDWVSTMATPIDVDNRPLIEFLAWITREHGWQLRYASATEERAVQSIRLHGSAKADTPAQTLKRVSLITGLSMDVEDGILTIGPGREPAR